MLRVASRLTPPSGREALNTGATYRGTSHDGLNYLFHNSLQRTLGEFREHHRACSIRRRGAAVIEVQRETQRTEFLSKKYMDTVRQEHSSTSLPIGLVSAGGQQQQVSNSASSSQLGGHHSSNSSTPTNISLSSNPLVLEEVKDSSAGVELNHPTLHSNSPMTETPPSSKLSIADSSKGKNDVAVKTEPPSSNGDTHSCSLNQSSSNVAKVSSGGSIARCSSAGKVRSRLRQTSKDFIQRSLSISHSTPISSDNDSENDLTFTADDAYRLGTPLKPLEEETTLSNIAPRKITPPPSLSNHSLQNGNARSTASTSSSTVATPTSSSSLTTTVPSAENALLMELDAFTKVMNQVERNEKAKERTQRRASCSNPCNSNVSSQQSSQQQQMIESPSHLMSPPPYPMNGATGNMYPPAPSGQRHAKQYTPPSHIQNCFDSRSVYQPHFDTNVHQTKPGGGVIHGNSTGIHPNAGGIHGNTTSIHSNPDTRFCPPPLTNSGESCQSPHLQLQHTSSHGQIGALLQSPTCSRSPSYDTLNHTFQHSMTSPVLHSPYPLWDSQGVVGVGGMSQSFSAPPRPGQKRNSISSLYGSGPPAKISHSTISHMPEMNQMSNEPSLRGFQTHPTGTMGTTHVPSYPLANYSHMS